MIRDSCFPVPAEARGYAIIAIGIFIIFATLHLDRIMKKMMKIPRFREDRPLVAGYTCTPDLSYEG